MINTDRTWALVTFRDHVEAGHAIAHLNVESVFHLRAKWSDKDNVNDAKGNY